MKIVIYGMGKIFEKYKSMLNWESVVAVIDKNAGTGSYDDMDIPCPILCTEKIVELDFDYIMIFSQKYFEEMKTELVIRYNIQENQIMTYWMFAKTGDGVFSTSLAEIYANLLECGESKKVLDVGMKHLPEIYLSKYAMCKNRDISIDGVCYESIIAMGDLYDNVYFGSESVQGKYDVVFLWEDFENHMDADKILEFAPQYIYYFRPYSFDEKKSGLDKILCQYHVSESSLPYGWLSIFWRKKELKDSSIYVVTHKKAFVHQDVLYKPICVGNSYRNQDFLSAHDGENIEYLNDRINECTALYWIWKNTKSEYVGLNHYRRYFCQDNSKINFRYLQGERIDEILNQSGYDIIFPEMIRLGYTLEQNIRYCVGDELYGQGVDIIRKGILKYQLQYKDVFEYVLGLDRFYACNMFVTRRSNLNCYCEWLFSFLIEAANSLDVTQNTVCQKRTIGFFAELMWTVWAIKNRLRIYELPVMKIE